MQDGRKKPKKEKITREEVARKLKEEHGIELSDPEDTLQKAWDSLNQDHVEKTRKILDKYLERSGRKENYSATIVRSIGITARHADVHMADQGGSGAFFGFLDHIIDKKDIPPAVYVRLSSFMKQIWSCLGKEGAYKWFDIIEEQAKAGCPRRLIDDYAVLSTRKLDAAMKSWSDIAPGTKPCWAVNPDSIKELIEEMHGNKSMRGKEAYFLELALNSGAGAARDFVKDTANVSLDSFLSMYDIRNACMKKEDSRKEELVAARLASFAKSIEDLEEKVQKQVAMHASKILKVDSEDKNLKTIVKASESINDAGNLLTAMGYAEKFITNWRYDSGLLEEYLDHAVGQTKKLYDFNDFQELLFQAYAQEKKKPVSEDGLFSRITERLSAVFDRYTSNLSQGKFLAAGKEFIEKKLHLSENRSQNILDFLEDYRRLFDVTQKRSRFVRNFIDSILQAGRFRYLPYIADLTKVLSSFAGSFSEDKFDAWEKMIADRFSQTDRINLPRYIKESVGSFAGASTEMIEEIMDIKESFFNSVNKKSAAKKGWPYFMPDEFTNAELVYLDAKKAAGKRISNEAFSKFFEFCCEYYMVVRPTLLPNTSQKTNLDDLYSLLEMFAHVPKKEQVWFLGRASMLFEEHARKVDVVRDLHQHATVPEVRSRLDGEWKIARDSLKRLIFSYFRGIPDRIRKLGPDTAKQWIDAGIAPKTLEEAVKYFSQRSYTSELSRDKLLQGTKYESVAGSLQTYAEGLADRRLSFDKTDSVELTSSIEEGKVLLPMTVNAFGNDYGKNYSVYKMLTSYQIAFLEFGTYNFDESLAKKIIERNQQKCPERITLANLMSSYANPDAAAYIFTLLENARVKSLLLEQYPGLRKEASVFEDYISSKLLDEAKDIDETEITMAVLYQTCMLGKPVFKLVEKGKKLEKAITEEVESILLPGSTVNDTLELTDRLYGLFGIEADNFIASEPPVASINLDEAVAGNESGGFLEEDEDAGVQTGQYLSFPEWDFNTGRIKWNFVHVYEHPVEIVEGDDFSAKVLMEDKQDLHKIRRQFEALKPEEYLTLKKQLSGDPDFDRIVEAKAMIKAGITPDEKLFMRRHKNQRSVATLFLTDLSGSLRKFLDLDNPTTRLLDIHKKTCLYMCEALENIGDAYAVYGFSGKTRQKVDTYLIKGFDEEYNGSIHQRISSLRPLQQNRDGAGIRYSTHLLSQRPEKTKIMVYLLEGAPHDIDYKGDYAIADTREALREARMSGLHPVIIFIGNSEEDAVNKIGDGFRFAHVSDINDVPAKLPDIYRRLTT